jgi:hypothetical protein
MAASALALSACGLFRRDAGVIEGSGQVTTETRAVSGVTAVALEGLGELTVEQGPAPGLAIEAEDNLLPLITSVVEGSTLRLGFDRAAWRDTIRPTQPIRYQLVVADLQALTISGAGDARLGPLSTDQLALNISGQGDIIVDRLQADRLEVIVSGAGDFTAAGQVGQQAITLSGTGGVHAGDLESQRAEVTVSGTGDVEVWAEAELAILISGAGSVSYYGDPAIVRRDITGAGDINPLGAKR